MRPAASVSSNCSSRSAARALASRRDCLASSPMSTRFWVPVSSSSRVASWPVTPMTRRTAAAWVAMSRPATEPEPPSGRIMVVSILTVVDLPAPLGPSTPRMAPSATSRSTPSTAHWSP